MAKFNYIIPLHPPKMTYLASMFPARYIARERDDSQDVLFSLIATNQEECALIKRYIEDFDITIPCAYEVTPILDYIKDAFGDDGLIETIEKNERSQIINVKKNAALHRALKMEHAAMVCIDVDTIFLKHPTALVRPLLENYARKIFFAAPLKVEIHHRMWDASCSVFSQTDQDRLAIIHAACPRISWFFDVPLYAAADLKAYLAYMDALHGGIAGFFKRYGLSYFRPYYFPDVYGALWRFPMGGLPGLWHRPVLR